MYLASSSAVTFARRTALRPAEAFAVTFTIGLSGTGVADVDPDAADGSCLKSRATALPTAVAATARLYAEARPEAASVAAKSADGSPDGTCTYMRAVAVYSGLRDSPSRMPSAVRTTNGSTARSGCRSTASQTLMGSF